ncbi:MAG: MFS transporter [Chloroflexota bacterium]|nr:MFS transporter [Chloroflexota bacterium]
MSVYVDLVRNNLEYRRLWLARVISNFGDWFNLLASAALITSLTGAGVAVSYLFLARFLPVFVMSPFAGVLADRYERRLIMAATDVLRAVTVLCFLLIRTADQLWLLYFLTVVQFVLSSLYTPAHSALLPSIVAPRDLVTANALDSFTWSTMLALGSLFGGLAAAALGLAAAFVIDALTFLLSAWFVLRIGSVPSGADYVRRAGFFDFVDGLRYLRSRRFILVLSLVKAAGALVWGAINVLEIPLAEQVFPFRGSGSVTLGIIYAATGIGTGLGPLIARYFLGDGRQAALRAITVSFAVLTAGVLLLGTAPTLPWIVTATLMRSVGTGTLWVFSSTILQSTVENRYRGRVFAFEFAALTLLQSVSTMWAGVAVDRLQLAVQSVFVLTSVVSLAVTLAWLAFQLRVSRRPVPAV